MHRDKEMPTGGNLNAYTLGYRYRAVGKGLEDNPYKRADSLEFRSWWVKGWEDRNEIQEKQAKELREWIGNNQLKG